MNKQEPIQFIDIDSKGRCKLTPEAEEFFSKIDKNVAVITVAGLYRTGKSYLLNRLLGRQSGFEIGPTTLSCTKGLWIWGETLKLPDKDFEIVLIDTEGLGSAFDDRNESIDMQIFSLSLLLSSYFIYNCMKNIDQTAVESLAMVINFAKKVVGQYQSVEAYTANYPTFLWVIRDFALNLVDSNNKPISPREYLENCLSEVSTDSQEEEENNRIKKLLKSFFKDRDCKTLVRPVNDEKKLRNIDKLDYTEIRPEFTKQMDLLIEDIYEKTSPKIINGTFLNGQMFVETAKQYINAINKGALPDIKNSFQIVLEKQITACYNKAVEAYHLAMQDSNFKEHLDYLSFLKSHLEACTKAQVELKPLIGLQLPLHQFEELSARVNSEVQDKFASFFEKWENLQVKKCQTVYTQLVSDYKECDKVDFEKTIEVVQEVCGYVTESVSNPCKFKEILPNLFSFFLDELKEDFKKSKNEFEAKISTLRKENRQLELKLSKQEDQFKAKKDELEHELAETKEKVTKQRLELESLVDRAKREKEEEAEDNKGQLEEYEQQIRRLNLTIENMRSSSAEPSLGDYRIEGLVEKIASLDNKFKFAFLEREKSKLKIDFNSKLDSLADQFRRKVLQAKEGFNQQMIKTKNKYNSEINKLKAMITVLE